MLKSGKELMTSNSQTIGASSTALRIYWVNITSAGTARTVSLYDGTDSTGSAQITLTGTANAGVVHNFEGGAAFRTGCFASGTGAATNVSFGLANEQ